MNVTSSDTSYLSARYQVGYGADVNDEPAATKTRDLSGPAWQRRPKRMALAVVEDLVDRIAGRELEAGDLLPPEGRLCEKYGASRTVLREAVQAVEAMRLVRSQQGQGTIVRPLEDWDLLNPVVLAAVIRHDAELAILEDLVDMRRTLESQMAAQAAARATDEQLAEISGIYEQLEAAASDPPRHVQLDLEFHEAIMRASGNRLARAAVLNMLAEGYRSVRYLGDFKEEDCTLSNVDHKEILDCLLDRNAERAEAAMNGHIVRAWLRRRPRRSDEESGSDSRARVSPF